MNTPAGKFAPPSPADLARLLNEFPLAWVVAAAADDFSAALLPLRPQFDDSGQVVELDGHLSRANPLVAALQNRPRALVLFMGPQGYISPSWMADRTQAPTWNYVSAQFVVDVTFTRNDVELDPLMADIVGAMESDRPGAWSASEMGPRYRKLADRVIGFHAAVRNSRVKFKLGQDERDDVYGDIMRGLAADGHDELLAWMQRSNPGRGPG